ncbi:helix-turn-helix domain-containing protein [Shinella yambaruensis]|nr:helix-turn-helix transcriptional regulator [Shinella yambaruensis]MCJ8029965.1 helix-turn-helix domain-containing protein [Shinella yambaruensis]MCU7984237.1 helix-turn-helix domain-containing protein [Shinella yambaruensis]
MRELFGRNLREARKVARLSQRDIHTISGYSQSFISEIETGKRSISLDNMAVLAKVLNVPLWTMLKP